MDGMHVTHELMIAHESQAAFGALHAATFDVAAACAAVVAEFGRSDERVAN